MSKKERQLAFRRAAEYEINSQRLVLKRLGGFLLFTALATLALWYFSNGSVR
ncbi:MAG: hypothetical protein Q8Q20_04585 [bacterium]|nr:hypothetical protein [bacterium]